MLQRIRGVIERDPRLSRVLHGGASALLGSVVALGVSAISLPLTVRYLGAEQYGILGDGEHDGGADVGARPGHRELTDEHDCEGVCGG